MTKIELPSLPDGEGWVVRHANGDESITGWPAQQDEKLQPVFTADQLRARDRQIVELCAQMVPTSWLDPLLDKAGLDLPPFSAGQVERLCLAIRAEIRNLLGDQHG